MQEVMDWIDRENARLEMVIKGKKNWQNPVPDLLRAALGDCV